MKQIGRILLFIVLAITMDANPILVSYAQPIDMAGKNEILSTKACLGGGVEIEPNENYLQANGPLCAGMGYQGLPGNNDRDYFYIELNAGGELTVNLANYAVADYHGQLLLYDEGQNLLVQVYLAPFHFAKLLPPGKYYLVVFTENGYGSSTPYTFTAAFQQCRAGKMEVEPNENAGAADGPLCSNVSYQGLPGNNDRDYFYVDLSADSMLTVDLTNYMVPEPFGQLILYDAGQNVIVQDYTAPLHIQQSVVAGKYYILVYTATGYASATPYELKPTFVYSLYLPAINR